MLNLIHMKYYHWLSLAMQLREYYGQLGESSKLVIPKNCQPICERIGLRKGDDYLFEGRMPKLAERISDTNINIVAHHHELSIPRIDKVVKGLIESGLNVSLSWYADGYTNRFLGKDAVHAYLKGSARSVPQKDVFYFGYISGKPPSYLNASEIRVCRGEHRASFSRRKEILDAIHAPIREIKKLCAGKRCLLVALRPWGSDAFQGGDFGFEDPAVSYANIVLSAMEVIKRHSRDGILPVVRPDARDPGFMADVVKEVLAAPGGEDAFILGDAWPSWLTLEPFIDSFHIATDPPLDVLGFDSTTSLPFLGAGTARCHYFGAPKEAIESEISNSTVRELLYGKIASLRQFASQNLYIQSGINMIDFDSAFFSVAENAEGRSRTSEQ